MKLWVTKSHNEPKYLLSFFKPIQKKIAGTDRIGIYVEPGDLISIPNMCTEGMIMLLGNSILNLKDGESKKIEITGNFI
jgi:hypothetical protein